MDCFNKWFGGGQEDEDDDVESVRESSKAVSFKIAAHDFGKFDGKPEHLYAFKYKTISTLGVAGFSSILDKATPMRDQEGTIVSTIGLKAQPMMDLPPIL